uniref:asparaginase n=1 Tax=Bionectria ochroleuca TaxID=29856 RepID=A0A8H7K1R6_BIOOC
MALEAIVNTKPEAVVAAGVGDGWFPEDATAVLEDAAAQGILIVIAARSGKIARATLKEWQIPCYDLDYPKCLALMKVALGANYNGEDIRVVLDGRGDEVVYEQGGKYSEGMSTLNAFEMSL